MQPYHILIDNVFMQGIEKEDRTGTGTLSLFGEKMVFPNVAEKFPLLQTKKTYWKGVVAELLWFIAGDTTVKTLQDQNVHIWDEWVGEDGTIGPMYGAMWRSWPCTNGGVVDQLNNVIEELKSSPDSRRACVSVWNPELLPDTSVSPSENATQGKMALAPCHPFFQFYSVEREGVRYLDLQVYIRSNDLFLGAPFNIASYALLMMMVAKVTGMVARNLHYVVGDAHIYLNHLEQVRTMQRRWMEEIDKYIKKEGEIAKYIHKEELAAPSIFHTTPQVRFTEEVSRIEDFSLDNIELVNYEPLPAIPAPVAV